MKNAKTVWTILVGLKDALVLGFMLLFFGMLFSALISSPNPSGARDGALLLNLKGTLVEQPDDVDPRDLLTGQAAVISQTRVRDVLRALDAAVKDDDTKTVVLDLNSFMGARAVDLADVGAALDKVRAAKKPVLAFATAYSDDAYLLAAHASEVWLDPMGGIAFAGPGGTQPYFKGLIDRLGINVHVYRVGKYKSFVEPYTRADQSPEAKQSDQALVDALWEDWRSNIAKARPKAQLDAAIANPIGAGGDLAKAALAYGLIDKIGDEDSFGKRVAEFAGNDDDDHPNAYNNTNLAAWAMKNPEKVSGDAIGIVHVAGAIVDGDAPAGTAGGDTIARLIQDALVKKKLKALVVRVDSPGGSAFASERIRLAMLDAKAKGLPVIVSMGNVAASGGYWVAMGGDHIFAEPATITGSIGVFGILPTFENTAARYGVTHDGVRTTPLSGQPDILGGTTPELDRFIQAGIDNTYARFLNLVAANRKMPLDKVQEIAQGRVWDGGAARQLGLVDAFGSLDDAIAEAAKRAKIDPANVRRVWLEKEPDFLTTLLKGAEGPSANAVHRDIISRMTARQEGQLIAGFQEAGRIMAGPAVQVRCISCPPPAIATRRSALLSLLLNREKP
jgi:protease IV